MLDGSVHTIQRNIEALVVASIENGLVVNADKTKHMVMSQYQNTGQTHNTKTEIVPLKVWNTSNVWVNLNASNSVQEESTGRSKLWNTCCHLVHNLSVCYPKI